VEYGGGAEEARTPDPLLASYFNSIPIEISL